MTIKAYTWLLIILGKSKKIVEVEEGVLGLKERSCFKIYNHKFCQVRIIFFKI